MEDVQSREQFDTEWHNRQVSYQALLRVARALDALISTTPQEPLARAKAWEEAEGALKEVEHLID
jgi:hypothetical protein